MSFLGSDLFEVDPILDGKVMGNEAYADAIADFSLSDWTYLRHTTTSDMEMLYLTAEVPEAVSRGAVFNATMTRAYAWRSGSNGFRQDFIHLWRELMKRTKVEMAGDCLAAAFSYWCTASEGERLGLIPDMMDELKLSRHIFDALSEEIRPPRAQPDGHLACSAYFRGYRNRMYGLKGKAPVMEVYNARSLVLMRAASSLRLTVEKWQPHLNQPVARSDEYLRNAEKWGNPALLMIADELETISREQ